LSFRGFILSTAFHGGVAYGLWVGWPYIHGPVPQSVPVIPIELITEAEIADEVSIPEMTRAEEPQEEILEPAAEPEPVEEEAPPPPEPEPEPQPAPDPDPVPPPPAEEEAEPEPEPEPEPLPEPETQDEPEPPRREPEPEPDPLSGLDDALLDLDPDKEEERRRPREVPEGTATGPVDTDRIGTGDTLTATEEALVQAKVYECWNRQTGVPNIEQLVVQVQFELNPDGSISGAPRVLNDAQTTRSGNRFWVAARARAVSAVTECAPYDFLPVERYETWRRMTLNFRPPAE
jgi:hypothetical protein